MSVEGTVVQPPGLKQYLIVHGRARIEQGGAAELLQRLAHVYLGSRRAFSTDARSAARVRASHDHRTDRRRRPLGELARQLLAQQLVHRARVGLALGLLHHLADEEPEQAFLAAAERRDLAGVRREDRVDQRRRARRRRSPRARRGTARQRTPRRRSRRSPRRRPRAGGSRAPRRACPVRRRRRHPGRSPRRRARSSRRCDGAPRRPACARRAASRPLVTSPSASSKSSSASSRRTRVPGSSGNRGARSARRARRAARPERGPARGSSGSPRPLPSSGAA